MTQSLRAHALILLVAVVGSPAFAARRSGLCLPRTAEAKKWPVCAIYMHGLFGSRAYPEKKWEAGFRANFEKVATAKKCRIAVPFGNVAGSGNYNWNGISMSEVRRRATAVCAPSTMVAKPSVIGFSNAANVLRRQSCGTLTQFSAVTLIGPTGYAGNDRARSCGRVTIIQPHSVQAVATLAKRVVAPVTSTASAQPRGMMKPNLNRTEDTPGTGQ